MRRSRLCRFLPSFALLEGLRLVSSTRQDLLVGLRCRRMRCSSSGPYRCTQRHTVVWSACSPRSSSSSSTSRSDSEYRKYQRTAQRIRSGSGCRHLKIAGRVVILGALQATSPLLRPLATHPSDGLVLNNPAAELRIPKKCQPGRTMRPLTEEEV